MPPRAVCASRAVRHAGAHALAAGRVGCLRLCPWVATRVHIAAGRVDLRSYRRGVFAPHTSLYLSPCSSALRASAQLYCSKAAPDLHCAGDLEAFARRKTRQ